MTRRLLDPLFSFRLLSESAGTQNEIWATDANPSFTKARKRLRNCLWRGRESSKVRCLSKDAYFSAFRERTAWNACVPSLGNNARQWHKLFLNAWVNAPYDEVFLYIASSFSGSGDRIRSLVLDRGKCISNYLVHSAWRRLFVGELNKVNMAIILTLYEL